MTPLYALQPGDTDSNWSEGPGLTQHLAAELIELDTARAGHAAELRLSNERQGATIIELSAWSMDQIALAWLLHRRYDITAYDQRGHSLQITQSSHGKLELYARVIPLLDHHAPPEGDPT